MRNFNFCVFCVLCVGYVFGGIINNEPPKININETEYIISSESNFNMTCQGKKSIIWTYPNETTSELNEFFSKIEVKTIELPKTEYPHLSMLIIRNASYVDTGYYYCHEIDAEKDAIGKSSKIYLYVKDLEHLSAIASDPYFQSVPQNSDAIIPCRPTSPDVQVSLTDFNGEKKYNPHTGFSIMATEYQIHATCLFERDGKSEEFTNIINVHPVPVSIEKPFIYAPNNGKTSVNETLVLNCTLKVEANVYFEITWQIPDTASLQSGRANYTKAYIDRNMNQGIGWSALTVKNVTLKDAGIYTCYVKDHVNNINQATKEIMVLKKNESHIKLSVVVNKVRVRANIKNNVTWSVTIDAYPKVNVIWTNNKGDKILPDTSLKYKVTKTNTSATLVIFNVSLDDSGIYQLEAMNEIEKKVLDLTVIVEDKPNVRIVADKYHNFNGISQLECIAAGYPLPNIKWYIKPCEQNNCAYEYINQTYPITYNDTQTIASVNVSATYSGAVKCVAENELGNDTTVEKFLVTDIDNGFNIWGIDNPSAIASGENVTFYCGASIYTYSDTIKWYIWRNNTRQPIPQDNRFRIEKNMTTFSHQVSLSIDLIELKDTGVYSCVAQRLSDKMVDSLNKTITVKKPFKPKIVESFLDDSEEQIEAGAPVTLNCSAEGIPAPEIIWKKNDAFWTISSNSHITLSANNTILSFKYLVDDDNGEYSCNAVNKMGTDSRKIRLLLLSSNKGKYLVITLVVLAIVFIMLCTFLIIRIRKEKKLRRELKIAGLQNFEKGALESLNPDLGVDDQAELLPYDRKWEFPRDKLKLGKQLGSGAFGVVMKADAYGLCEEETVTTVAVKMVKRNADYTYIKALASELKIMVHLGKHLNVVNLLGACTKNVAKRELLVIVEYCRFGNLHNYLLRHRDDFINQIDPQTGTIDASIGAEYLNRTMSVGSTQSGTRSPTFAGVDYRSTPLTNSCNTDSTVVCSPSGEDAMILSNNSAQPEWRSNYRGDYNKGNVKPISTHDLLCWAFQVARGMEYLASRKVLHGDLAARNILLAEDNIVKICDFGLAKSMYKSDNYKKKGDGPLPVKWMAVESIRDRVFSTQSDVWSYGIVLWEFFSLARTPYPGMDADERLYNKLIEGYRMDKPEYATKDIYQIILECWDAKPVYRPSFNKLAESLGSMLQESVRQHYISLNDPYIIMNNTQMEGHSDYLAMLSPPDYGNLASPSGHEYVNGLQIPEDQTEAEASTSGYLPMDIFSPKPNGNIFDFETQKKAKSHEDGSGTELLPILHSHVDSDSELSSPTSPISSTKNFANPGYNMLPVIEDKNKMTVEPKKDILPSSDNYINMPQQKKALTDAFSNPNYVDINKKNDNNYVNSQSRDWERL